MTTELKPVYPRWRGEHIQRLSRFFAQVGLSPLARGTRHPDNKMNPDDRFIPASAGNTVYYFSR